MKVCLVLTVNEIVLFHLNIHLSFYFNLHVKMWMNDASISGGWHFQQFLAFFFLYCLFLKLMYWFCKNNKCFQKNYLNRLDLWVLKMKRNKDKCKFLLLVVKNFRTSSWMALSKPSKGFHFHVQCQLFINNILPAKNTCKVLD